MAVTEGLSETIARELRRALRRRAKVSDLLDDAQAEVDALKQEGEGLDAKIAEFREALPSNEYDLKTGTPRPKGE